MAMNKVKSPLVKVLRKAGYSVKDAMNITLGAQHNYHSQMASFSRNNFNNLAFRGEISGMFKWIDTPEGREFWLYVQCAVIERYL